MTNIIDLLKLFHESVQALADPLDELKPHKLSRDGKVDMLGECGKLVKKHPGMCAVVIAAAIKLDIILLEDR